MSAPPTSEARRPDPVGVVFLGTSSGQPTTKRNLSCIALQRKGELFLFDCGEGSQIQFRRANLRFGQIAGIFITHMHGDHVTGLPGILMSLQMTGRTEPLRIVGPKMIGEYIESTFRLLESGLGFPLVVTEHDAAATVLSTDDYTLRVEPLDHRIPTIGYRFEERDFPGRFDVDTARARGALDPRLYGVLQRGADIVLPDGSVLHASEVVGPPRRGKSFAYCSDTRPCDGSVTLGRGVDFMVHESTFCDARAANAEATGHSTAAQAAEVGARAGARRLVLTHFSPRYDDLDFLLEQARPHFATVEAAHELAPMDV